MPVDGIAVDTLCASTSTSIKWLLYTCPGERASAVLGARCEPRCYHFFMPVLAILGRARVAA